MQLIDMQKVILNIYKIMIKVTNHHILNIDMLITDVVRFHKKL